MGIRINISSPPGHKHPTDSARVKFAGRSGWGSLIRFESAARQKTRKILWLAGHYNNLSCLTRRLVGLRLPLSLAGSHRQV